MALKDWVAVGGLLAAVAAGSVYVGELHTRVKALEDRDSGPEGLEKRIEKLEGMLDLDQLRREARAAGIEAAVETLHNGDYTNTFAWSQGDFLRHG